MVAVPRQHAFGWLTWLRVSARELSLTSFYIVNLYFILILGSVWFERGMGLKKLFSEKAICAKNLGFHTLLRN